MKDESIRRRIPRGYKLPRRFDDFVRAKPPFRIEWDSLDCFCLKRTAIKEAVPFIRLSDGGLIAFWYHSRSPAIVYFGSEGELRVVAQDFDNFLKGIGAMCSGLSDIDDDEHDFRVPGVEGKPTNERLPVLQEKFEKWFKKHTSLQEPTTGPAAEALRQRVYQIAEEMIRDGLSKVYTLSSHWWSLGFQIERNDLLLEISYRDYGEWYPLPKKYKLIQEVVEMLRLAKHKTKSHYELSVSIGGIVSIDNGRVLLLVPPEAMD